MEITNVELRGRLMVMELLLPLALTRLAHLSGDAAGFIHGVMANAEDMIERATATAQPDEQQAAQFARAAFNELSDAMQEHLAHLAKPHASA